MVFQTIINPRRPRLYREREENTNRVLPITAQAAEVSAPMGRAAPGAALWIAILLDRIPASRAANPHPCRPLHEQARGRGHRRFRSTATRAAPRPRPLPWRAAFQAEYGDAKRDPALALTEKSGRGLPSFAILIV